LQVLGATLLADNRMVLFSSGNVEFVKLDTLAVEDNYTPVENMDNDVRFKTFNFNILLTLHVASPFFRIARRRYLCICSRESYPRGCQEFRW